MGTGKGTDIVQQVDATETPATTANTSQTNLAAEIAEPARSTADRATQIAESLSTDLPDSELLLVEIVDLKENIEAALEAACGVAWDGGEMPIEGLDAFEILKDNKAAQTRAISKYFGIDLSNPTIARTYKTQGTPGTEGEREITVDVIQTDKPDVFVGRWTYSDGSIGWTVRALELEEE